ncbi:hypothetical protein D3C87_613580 [compost metagenome]
MIAAERCVELAHLAAGLFVSGADDDPVRAHAVGEGAAFLEEFRVGHHPHLQISLAATQQFAVGGGQHLIGGADRHRGFDDQRAIGLHVRGDLAGDVEHVAEIGRAVLIGGGADGDENQLGMLDRVTGLGTEQQAAGLDVFLKRAGQTWLTNGRHCLLQLFNFVWVNVHA